MSEAPGTDTRVFVPRMYLAHHELESVIFITIIVMCRSPGRPTPQKRKAPAIAIRKPGASQSTKTATKPKGVLSFGALIRGICNLTLRTCSVYFYVVIA